MNKEQLVKISETIRDHLIKQNAQSLSGDKCVYRGDYGRMCAVGVLIKDEFYHKSLESKSCKADLVANAVSKSLDVRMDQSVYKLLAEWQVYHDGSYSTYLQGNSERSPDFVHDALVADLT